MKKTIQKMLVDLVFRMKKYIYNNVFHYTKYCIWHYKTQKKTNASVRYHA